MEWSFEGALLRVEKGETQATRFTYDAGGNRVQALTRDGAKMSAANYLVDENTAYAQVLEERDSSGELQARYVYGQGYGPILLQRRQKNAANVEEIRTRYLLADGHGSVRQLVTESGVVTDSYFYDAWGGGLSGGSGNTVNPYRYNGQQMDEATGGYYLRARYYQPGNGRFLGHDPVLGVGSDPVTLHRYLYANADGANFIDPTGKFGFSLAGVTVSMNINQIQVSNSAGTSTIIYKRVAKFIYSNFAVPGLIGGNVVGAYYGFTGQDYMQGFLVGARIGVALKTASMRGRLVEAIVMGSLTGLGAAVGQHIWDSAKGFDAELQQSYTHKFMRSFIENFAEGAEGVAYNVDELPSELVTFGLTLAQELSGGDSFFEALADAASSAAMAFVVGRFIPDFYGQDEDAWKMLCRLFLLRAPALS